MNSSTSSQQVWNKVRKIKGKTFAEVSALEVNGTVSSTASDISETLAFSFENTFSSNFYDPRFRAKKANAETRPLNFQSPNDESYNTPFSFWELESALGFCNNSSPGPDNIPFPMILHLPKSSLLVLLSIYNKIWSEDVFPSAWRESIIVPIPKPGKDRKRPESYRPISLTCCLCKILERMVNRRLVWFLESNQFITNIQCGFRRGRSAADHLIRLETLIQDAFVNRQHVLAVFFDLEKAYDTTWRRGIMNTLQRWGLQGRMALFVQGFMSDRIFRVRCGNILSSPHYQENGVPQGSVLSVTLFAIAINSIHECLPRTVTGCLYVDDLAIFCSSNSTRFANRQLQNTINNLEVWASDRGFKFSATKTSVVHFCRKRNCLEEPNLSLRGNLLPVREQQRFLGLIFDRKLSWIPHISATVDQCKKSLTLMRTLSSFKWGADRTVLLRLYRMLIRSKIDYGCIVYGSARKSYIKRLDTIHNAGLRISIGAFRTSPVMSLYSEAGEPPLEYRRQRLMLGYAASLAAKPDHLLYPTVFNRRHGTAYDRQQYSTKSFSERLATLRSDLDISIPDVTVWGMSQSAPWLTPRPICRYDLSVMSKENTHPQLYVQSFRVLREQLSDHVAIYTDGSKTDDGVGCSFVSQGEYFRFKLSPYTPVYTAELFAILTALKYIAAHANNKFILCTDSLSALRSIESLYPETTILRNIHTSLLNISANRSNVVFCWIPGHVGIPGNEKADKEARLAISDQNISWPFAIASDIKSSLQIKVQQSWESTWYGQVNNKLCSIKNTAHEWKTSKRESRREEVILSRLRIGHTYLTHSHLLKGEHSPVCETCDADLTVSHLLLDCVQYAEERERFGLGDDLPRLLGDDQQMVDRVLKFIAATGLRQFL